MKHNLRLGLQLLLHKRNMLGRGGNVRNLRTERHRRSLSAEVHPFIVAKAYCTK